MAYEKVGDVPFVALGGINKLTGQPNPKSIEGYFVRVEQRPNAFKKGDPQNFYIFLTKEGEVGVYDKGYMRGEMKNAKIGLMTLLTHTGIGKAAPGKNAPNLYEVKQDPSLILDESTASYSSIIQDEPYEDDESEPLDEVVAVAPQAPTKIPTLPSADRQAKLQAMLKTRRA